MKGRKHTPEQIVRKLREEERLIGEGKTVRRRGDPLPRALGADDGRCPGHSGGGDSIGGASGPRGDVHAVVFPQCRRGLGLRTSRMKSPQAGRPVLVRRTPSEPGTSWGLAAQIAGPRLRRRRLGSPLTLSKTWRLARYT